MPVVRLMLCAWVITLSIGCTSTPIATPTVSPAAQHIPAINQEFLAAGIAEGTVIADNEGLLKLVGVYQNNAQVNEAFTIARKIAGDNFVSPETPENIKNMTVTDAPPGPMANKFALVIGVGNFAYLEKSATLNYARKDAEAVKKFLISPTGGSFPKDNVSTLLDEQATATAIEQKLQDLQYQAKRDDLVFVYFSSHGSDPKNGDGGVSIITHNTRKNETGFGNTISRGLLTNFMFHIAAKRLVVIADICHSGDVADELFGFKGLDQKEIGQGMKDIFPVGESSLSFKNGPKWGKIYMAASSSEQKAYEPSTEEEKKTIDNSFFTHYFLQGLWQSGGNINQAFEYARVAISDMKKDRESKPQAPQIKTNPMGANFSLR